MANEKDDASELRLTLSLVMDQAENDLKAAHDVIAQLQGLNPEKSDWPQWSSPANTIRWFAELRERFGIPPRAT